MSARRLIVVSNRVMHRGRPQAGGMAQALLTLLAERSGAWLGWSGTISEHTEPHSEREGCIDYLTWNLSRAQHRAYYRDFANRVLWPLLHGRTDLIRFTDTALQGYLGVNEVFADHVMHSAEGDELLWVHDYHLIPLASVLRRRGYRGRIGLFLHTPVPEARTLTTLPHHREILGSLGAYDLIGVQTPVDARALSGYLRDECGAHEAGSYWLRDAQGRPFRIRSLPIGIDPAVLAQQAVEAEEEAAVRELRDSLGGRQLLIGVDRLDYSKGIPQRLQAFGELLRMHPQYHDRASLLQITPESRREVIEYRQLSQEVQRLVGDINGHHAGPAWTPIRYVNRPFPHEQLTGFYRLSDVGVVTPLRDGMNLVAKEFIASQPEYDPGVLVLSEFAGAAVELEDVALIVNPNDIAAMAATYQRALSMPLERRQRRWRRGMELLEQGHVQGWGRDFLQLLSTPPPTLEQGEPPALPQARPHPTALPTVP